VKLRVCSLAVIALCGLAACAPAPSAGSAAASAAATSVGAQLFDTHCAACHQYNAQGVPGVYPSLTGSAVVRGDPAVLARWVILGQRPESMPAGRYPTAMLKFGWLKEADAAALFTYLRTQFGNGASAVDAATVTRALDVRH